MDDDSTFVHDYGTYSGSPNPTRDVTDAEPDLYYTPRDGHTIYLCHPAHPFGPGTYLVHADSNAYLGKGTFHADGGGLYFDTWEPASGSGAPGEPASPGSGSPSSD